MNKIIILTIFMCAPFYLMSQASASPQQNIDAINLLKRSDNGEHEDWKHEANRRVKAFYRHLKVLTNTKIERKYREEAFELASNLFGIRTLEKIKICDNVLLDNKQKNYDIIYFLEQMLELKEVDVEIINVNPPPESNGADFDSNTAMKKYEITETIKVTTDSKSETYNIKKTIIVHFVFLKNLDDDRINWVIRIGSITCK